VQITSHALDNRDARFSPDGRTIAYSSNRTGNDEIWLHHLDGRAETRFTDNESDDVKPDWSPDGRRILFASDRDGGRYKLFIAAADGGTEPRLLTDQATNWSRSNSSLLSIIPLSQWSPDGDSIAYRVVGDEGPELWTVDPDGLGARKRLEGVTGFDWYGGSRQGLITRRRGTEEELLAIDLESGREQSLFVGALQQFDVAPDGSAVAFCYGRGHLAMGLAVLQLEAPSDPDRLPRAVGEPEYVVPTDGTWHIHNGGWSPDSNSLVYTRDQDYGDLYELIEKQ
jgi:dipeptidyl aminopeptidase/acylaminoacyl peptidase